MYDFENYNLRQKNMKNGMLILILSLALLSCTSKEEKSKKLVTDYIVTKLPQSWKYESLEFDKIDSAFSDIWDTPQYKEKLREINPYDSIIMLDSLRNPEQKIRLDPYFKEQRNIKQKELDELRRKFTKSYIGYSVVHFYKCKTEFGDSIYVSRFIIDKDFKKIISKTGYANDSKRYDSIKAKSKNFLIMNNKVNWAKVFQY